jgi:hypothetical protein
MIGQSPFRSFGTALTIMLLYAVPTIESGYGGRRGIGEANFGELGVSATMHSSMHPATCDTPYDGPRNMYNK